MQIASSIVLLFSVLIPTRMWYSSQMSPEVKVEADARVKLSLVLTDMAGKVFEPQNPADVSGGQQVDLKRFYPVVSMAGTYVLWAVPPGKSIREFVGTPVVITVRTDKRPGGGQVMCTKMEPLRYAAITTDQGPMTVAFYYDVAPHTIEVFQQLCEQGFYDGLTFHRILPGFLIQGGDPRGDGTGGPGFDVAPEFSNDRKQEEGVVSMARVTDPLEPQMKPRCEYAITAGSQFFICLGRNEPLDGRYTAFGKVCAGMETVKKLAAVKVSDERTGRPVKPPVIQKIEIKSVTRDANPYLAIMTLRETAGE